MSHRNGHYLNTDHDPIRDGQAVKVRASRPIAAGEEIYTSYNFCTDCQARTYNYGTAELVRTFSSAAVGRIKAPAHPRSHDASVVADSNAPLSCGIMGLSKTTPNGGCWIGFDSISITSATIKARQLETYR